PILCLLAVFDEDRRDRGARKGERTFDRREIEWRNDGVGNDHRPTRSEVGRVEPGLAEKTCADVDRIGPAGERYTESFQFSSNRPSRCRAKVCALCMPVSTTTSAISRYSGSRSAYRLSSFARGSGVASNGRFLSWRTRSQRSAGAACR